MKVLLEALLDKILRDDPDFAESLIADEDIEGDFLDELPELDGLEEDGDTQPEDIDRKQLNEEIRLLAELATGIGYFFVSVASCPPK